MHIINNRAGINHQTFLLDCFEKSDRITIVSPFVSNSFNFFPFDKLNHLVKITLLTTLKPNDLEQLNKVTFFRNILDFGKSENIEIEILIDNSLHGKIYIGQKENLYFKAIITSANFTTNGLRINNEWGICIDKHNEIDRIVTELRKNVVTEPITDKIVTDFENKIRAISKPSKGTKYDLDLINSLKLKENPLNITSKVNYWLKPIGLSDDPIPVSMIFDEIDYDLHFSQRKPRSIKKGDILIAYAVGHKNILSIYKVVSEVKNTKNINERWPYFIVGENLTPFYGNEWSNRNITISNQKNDALNNGITKLTPSGKNSYGNLMRGADKLRITKEFADFIINKVVRLNDKIATMSNTNL